MGVVAAVAAPQGPAALGTGDGQFGQTRPGLSLVSARCHQNLAPGDAMDRAEIVSIHATVRTPAGESPAV